MCDGPNTGAHVSFHQRQDASRKSGAPGVIPKSRVVEYSSRIEEEANSGEPDIELFESEHVQGYHASAHTNQESSSNGNAQAGAGLSSAAAATDGSRHLYAQSK